MEGQNHPEMPVGEALSMMMEQLGYMRIGGKDLDEETIRKDEETIKKVESVFDKSQKVSSGPYRYCKGGVECERFLSSKEQLLGKRYNEVRKQGPAIFEIIGNEPKDE